MAFQDQSLTNANPNNNYFSHPNRKYNEGKVPLPSEIISASSHILIIDSRERNREMFPNPSKYSIRFNNVYKNVTSVELKGSIIPKTEYNVHTQNNKIVFNVEDYITSATIIDPGFGYVDGVYGFGAVPPNDTLALVSSPAITGGVNALITVTVLNNKITSVIIANPGSGYLRGSYGGAINLPSEGFYSSAEASFINLIPFDLMVEPSIRAKIKFEVGHELVAELNIGQYDFAHPNDSEPGLCREVTRALQEATQNAIDDGILVPVVGGPQTGAEYFPYSIANSSDGSCYLFTPNPNASENTNVAIQRGDPTAGGGGYTQSLFLELLWGASNYEDSLAMTLLGYGSEPLVGLPYDTPLDQTTGTTGALVAWTETPIRSNFDYCLTDFPKYCILSFGKGSDDNAGRIESTNSELDKAFAILVFDANAPDVVFREPAATPVDGEGNSNWSTLLYKPGTLKGIKGADYDQKVLSFGPAAKGKLDSISIEFSKLNGELYDFKGKDHTLIFEIGANDINSGNRY